MNIIRSIVIFTILAISAIKVLGHGMVMDPVGRGSAWRKGFRTPRNYDDNQNYCGGFSVQFFRNHGKCGACGDNYAMRQPRPHENGGVYGTGLIVKTYKAGSIINVDVKLTANHKGYFEFALCPLKHERDVETEECFKQYPLHLTTGGTRFPVNVPGSGNFNVKLVLPPNLKCKHCSLRWHYTAGNNWGTCPDGTGHVGCGNQETFRTCSDIAIE